MIYYSFHVLGFIAIAIYMWIYAPKYEIKRTKALIFTVITYFSVYALMLVLFYIVTGHFGGQNIVRIFIFVPPIAALYASAMGLNIGKTIDLVAPLPCIAQGISHFGCLFPGCCRSWWQVPWGIYNEKTGTTLFPVQIAEALTCLIIVVIVILIAKKYSYNAHGITMGIMLLLFGITRFGWEFLRDNEKIFLNVSNLALWAVASAIMGAVWIIVFLNFKRAGKIK